MIKNLLFLPLSLLSYSALAQGHIDHIKNQEYLKYKNSIDCNNLSGDNLSERVCANLAFQRADSLLTVVYDSLLLTDGRPEGFGQKLIEMQTTWRLFRDQHCGLVYDSYEGCGGCHRRAIDYLHCLTELTEDRVKDLKKLY